jgi:hypothetical protein
MWIGEVLEWFQYITDGSRGSETLPVIYRKVSEEIRSNRTIYGKSRIC